MVVVHRKTRNVTFIGTLPFLPGMNNVSDGDMEKINSTPNLKRILESEIACGNMVIGGQYNTDTSQAADAKSPTERAEKLVEEVKSMSASDAKKIISEMTDPYLIKALLKADTRKGIQKALEDRQVAIQAQIGDDLSHVSVTAPLGDGSDVVGQVTGSKEDIEGMSVKSAIPALGGR